MITLGCFIFMIIMLFVMAIISFVILGIGGAAIVVVFADVIIFIALIVWIAKRINK